MKLFMLVVGMINVASFGWTKSLAVEENKANQFLCAAAEKNSRWQNAKITYITSVKEGFSGPVSDSGLGRLYASRTCMP